MEEATKQQLEREVFELAARDLISGRAVSVEFSWKGIRFRLTLAKPLDKWTEF